MLDLCKLIFGMVIDLLWSRAALEAEILVLRQQINVLRRASSKRPPFISIDRLILGGICRLFPKIYDALADCHRFYRLREMPSHAHCGAVSTSGNIQASAHIGVIGEVVKDLHAHFSVRPRSNEVTEA
jgi:hypothetical protein